VVVVGIDFSANFLVSGPDVVSRGFVYVREAEEMMEEIRGAAEKSVDDYLNHARFPDRAALKTKLKDELAKFVYAKTKRRPMILPIIMDV
jgi:ribonuclease J